MPVDAPHRAVLYRRALDLRAEAEERGMPDVLALVDYLIAGLDRFAPAPSQAAGAKDGAA